MDRRKTASACFIFTITFFIILLLAPSYASDQERLEGIVKEGASALSYAEGLGIKKPVVRIGLLGEDKKISISSNGGFRIIETATGLDIWKESYTGEVLFLPIGTGESSLKLYRVQIGSFESKEQADLLKQKVELETGFPAIVKYYPDRRIHRVRVGEEKSQDALQPVAAKLKEMGYSEIWISEELPEWKGNVFIRIVDREYNSMIAETDSLTVLPKDPAATVNINGKSFRGFCEIKVYSTGAIRAINILNIEDYLKGVVPLELGPELWPELEALKAQAVAARTYLYKNLGQFEEEGFDICDSQRCQVYGGKDAEHPLSNRAVDETYGLIAAYEGAPINALYTSTCGGMTEDGSNIFEEEKGAYLKAVECYPDKQSLLSKTYTILASEEIPLDEIGGEAQLLKSFALLMVHGIFDGNFLKEEWDPKKKVRSDDVLKLLLKAAGLCGIDYKEFDIASASAENVEEFWESASKIFSINRRADLQISEKDTGVLVQSTGSDGMQKVDSRLMAYLIREGIIPAELSYGISPSEKVAQDYLILSLANIVKRYGGFKIKEGSFREMSDGTISFLSNSEGEKIQLSKQTVIFNYSGGSAFPVDSIRFIPGEKFFYHAGSDGAIDYLEKKPPVKGASNDRYSVNYTWDVTLSREELEKSINQKIPIGELVDLQEVRRGRSGRVIEMRIIGSAGEYTVKGLNVRNALQLKENLFTMDKRRTADGKLLSIAFSGKGWGHGVGLCQVGAYGMALRGKRYDEILKWYYSGISILKAYD